MFFLHKAHIGEVQSSVWDDETIKVCRERGIREVWSEVSQVRFRELSAETIRNYIQCVNTLDKAGAYAIQEHGEMIIEHLDGELENVIGLPLIQLQ